MKKKTAPKKSTRSTLKSIKLAVCLSGDWIHLDSNNPQHTLERDAYLKKFFKGKTAELGFLPMDQIEKSIHEVAENYDVLITHVPPYPDGEFRSMCNELRSEDRIALETFLFADYSHSLNTVHQLKQAGLPVVGYTKANDDAVELFRKIDLFHSVIKKTGYFVKDCEELKTEVQKAFRSRLKK